MTPPYCLRMQEWYSLKKFLGIEQHSYTKATSSQRCVRAGGKHNDLENVGYTRRHHTFFEMLGNFSFGDYFKREAIHYAWQFLTEMLKIPRERLWVTVYRDDKESEDIWLNEIKVNPNTLTRCGEKDNFWQMGETGPCGPCTEIFYDHGPEVDGGPPGSPNEDGDRYVEIWNVVFMQYEKDLQGQLKPLPMPCVDTGMGLERIAAVVQGVHDNYDIDLFQSLLSALSKLIGYDDFSDKSMRVIVDHIRSCSFLIIDGAIPSNEGRGYVLRRIIRRAIRHGYKLGQQDVFFYHLVQALVNIMGAAYPELVKSQSLIEQVIKQEEEQFSKTLTRGMKVLEQAITELSGDTVPGSLIFQLYDTYGFPPDLTADVAREFNFTLDYDGFNAEMKTQREKSQRSKQFSVDHTQRLHIVGESKFVGYERLEIDTHVQGLLQDNKPVVKLSSEEKGTVVLKETPFYSESGGQVGDTGYLYFSNGSFRVDDTQKQGDVYLHIGEMRKGSLQSDEAVRAEVDVGLRQAIRLNHSATHLLHEALRRVLGDHVRQKGSLVESKRLRFDFSHTKAMTLKEVQAVERLVNQQVRENLYVNVSVMTPDEAKDKGALALFGERYGKQVRVLKMGEFSTEICGGTHVARTGDIGLFKITSESACASGIRRIEAVTGESAVTFVESEEEQLLTVGELLRTAPKNVVNKASQLLEQFRGLEKEVQQLKQQVASQQTGDIISQAKNIHGIRVLACELKGIDREAMRVMLDQLKHQLKPAAIVLSTVADDKIQFVAGVSKECLKFFNANELLSHVAKQVGGKGGGRPEMAQGGGTLPKALPQALESVFQWVCNRTDGKH